MTGQIVAFKLPLKGKLEGKTLKVGYDEGQVHVDATLELEPSGNAFKGTFQASNGNRGSVERLAARPGRRQGRAGRFLRALADRSRPHGADAGRLEGQRARMRFAARRASRARSRAATWNSSVKAFRTGPGWFDLDEKGTSLPAQGGPTACAAWYGWNGRKAPEFVRHAPAGRGQDRPGLDRATC